VIEPYATEYFPPIPVLEVSLAVPLTSDWHGPISAIVDTGADFTIIPESLLEPLQLPPVRQAVIRSQWHVGERFHLYRLDVRIGGLIFPSIEVAGDPISDDFVLGRNLLNYLDLRLEGPRQRIYLLSV
jgi:predicted aspartyl protease